STQFLLVPLSFSCHLRQLLLTPPMHNFSAPSSRSPFLFGTPESMLPNEDLSRCGPRLSSPNTREILRFSGLDGPPDIDAAGHPRRNSGFLRGHASPFVFGASTPDFALELTND
ncbi:hypothetical protein K438DRAFT_1874096, partial [Mycena galopus ATCC 62051]